MRSFSLRTFMLAGCVSMPLACGGAPAKPVEPPSITTTERPAKKHATDIFVDEGEIEAVVDARSFRASSAFTTVLVALAGTPYENLEQRFEKSCHFKLFDNVGTVAFRAKAGAGIVAIDVKPNRDDLYACAKEIFGPMADIKVGAEPALLLDPQNHVVFFVDDGVLLLGDKVLILEFLRQKAGAVSPAEIKRRALGRNEIARVEVTDSKRLPEGFSRGTVRVVASPNELSARANARANDAAFATQMATTGSRLIASQRAEWVKSGLTAAVAIADSVAFATIDDEVTVTIGVKGNVVAQTEYLANLSALAVHETRRYILAAKEAEARNVLEAVAKSISMFNERELPSGKTPGICPATSSRVPAVTPKGEPYVSASSDWVHPTWQSLAFSMDGPQRYSYEVVTAKDRKSCKIVAHGDLDGNGKESRFELEVRIVKGRAVVGKIVEQDPDE